MTECSDLLCNRPVHARGLCQHHYDITPERRAHFRAKHHKDPSANYKRTIRRLRARIRVKEAYINEILEAHADLQDHVSLWSWEAEQRKGRK